MAYNEGLSTRLIDNKLVYNGKIYGVNTIHEAGLNAAKISERRTGNEFRFYGRFSILSNFHPVNLIYKGQTFRSAEQLYHFRRAEESGDMTLAVELLMTNDPAECKHLARRIPEDRDRDVKIMKTVLEQKFALARCKEFLLKTGKLNLTESNPYDAYWSAGIGLDERVDGPYRGKNLLGKALMEIRQSLR